MSIPTHFNGSLLNIMGGGAAAPPPPTNPITSIQIDVPDEAYGALVANLYFGTGGATTGYYTNKTTFLTNNPGLTLQPFTGFAAPNAQISISTFTGFTVSARDGATSEVSDSGWYTGNFPFLSCVYCTLSDGQITITFSPSVTAVGCNVAATINGVTTSAFRAYNGVTLLTNQTFTPARLDAFTTFTGYVSS